MAADQLGQHRELAAGDLHARGLGADLQARRRSRAERLRVGLLDGEVVEQRDRLGADADEVVDVHRDAVDADRVEAAGLLGDDELGADAVGARARCPRFVGDPQHDGVVARCRRPTRDGRPVSIVAQHADQRADAAVGLRRCRRRRRRTRRSSRRDCRTRAGATSTPRAPRGRRRRARAARSRSTCADQPTSRRASRRTPRRRRPRTPRRSSGGRPRRASRAPFSSVAPTITGSATWRESTFASRAAEAARSARRRASRRCARRRARARTPARGRARARRRASRRRACAPPRRARVGGDHRQRAGEQPDGDRRGAPRRRSIGRSSASPAIAGGTNEPAISTARRRSKPRAASPTSSRRPISSAAAVPACSATSNALRSSGSSSRVRPAEQPRHQPMCAEEETGSSSAGPCSDARARRAWRSGSARVAPRPCIGAGLARPAAAAAPPADDEVGDRRATISAATA